MNDDPILKQINDSAEYTGLSYCAVAEVAAVIEDVTDKERRAMYRRVFKQKHNLTAQVWARVPDWFSGFPITRGEHMGMEIRDYKTMTEKELRSASYLCQLPKSDFLDLYDAIAEQLDDHIGVLNQVNAVLDAIRHERANGTARQRAKPDTLAERVAYIASLAYEIINDPMRNDIGTVAEAFRWIYANLSALPEVASALAARNGEAK